VTRRESSIRANPLINSGLLPRYLRISGSSSRHSPIDPHFSSWLGLARYPSVSPAAPRLATVPRSYALDDLPTRIQSDFASGVLLVHGAAPYPSVDGLGGSIPRHWPPSVIPYYTFLVSVMTHALLPNLEEPPLQSQRDWKGPRIKAGIVQTVDDPRLLRYAVTRVRWVPCDHNALATRPSFQKKVAISTTAVSHAVIRLSLPLEGKARRLLAPMTFYSPSFATLLTVVVMRLILRLSPLG
jgi:hypothetical protein